MNKMNTRSLVAALSLMVMVAACGKNMSLQVNGAAAGDGQNETSETIDTTKASQKSAPKNLSNDEELQAFSEFDVSDVAESLKVSGNVLRRATVQVAPKDAITEILKMELVLKKSELVSVLLEKTDLCLIVGNQLADCRTISTSEDELKIDILEVFGLKEKSLEEQVEWIYANTTAFADPGYRKFRFILKGFKASVSGILNLQVTVDNKKMPENFATAPTCFENGDADQIEAVTN